jgi:hypothetical protein
MSGKQKKRRQEKKKKSSESITSTEALASTGMISTDALASSEALAHEPSIEAIGEEQVEVQNIESVIVAEDVAPIQETETIATDEAKAVPEKENIEDCNATHKPIEIPTITQEPDVKPVQVNPSPKIKARFCGCF